ncbi:TPA: hypothetical protein EYG59_18345 [Candidatus Poribacteria bacterium]|nr:hypothetical protein [Candidatus Poribacteria bacterium]
MGLGRQIPKLSLGTGELVVIWGMMSVSASIPSKAFVEYLLPALVAPGYFATPENQWHQLFHAYIPVWLAPQNFGIARGFYEGMAGGEILWDPWIVPLLIWMLYALSLYGAMICLNVILRHQWIQNERMAFPLVQLPSEIIGSPQDSGRFPTFFKNRWMWITFTIAGTLHLFNGLHFYFPQVPLIPTRFSLDPFLAEKPFSAIRPLPLDIHLSVIGITYLLAEQVSFSIWFFYLFYKFECFVFVSLGLPMPSSPGEFGFTRSFASHQEMGAFLVIMCLIGWQARKRLLVTMQSVFVAVSKNRNLNEREFISDEHWALLGLLLMFLIQIILSQLMGISLWVALSIASFSAIMWVIFTWQVSSSGVLIVHPTFRPMMLLRTMFGDRRIGAYNLTLNTFQARGFRTDLTQLIMPHVMNTFKLSNEKKTKSISLLMAMIAAIFIVLPVSSYFFLRFTCKVGANTLGLSWVGRTGFRVLESRLIYPADMDPTNLGFFLLGIISTLSITLIYHRFLWWPLHPIGCTTGSSWGIQMFFLSIFLGWLLKYLTLKYSGLKTYSRARPMFLG